MHIIWQDLSPQQQYSLRIIAALAQEQEALSVPSGDTCVPPFVQQWVLYGVVAGQATPLYQHLIIVSGSPAAVDAVLASLQQYGLIQYVHELSQRGPMTHVRLTVGGDTIVPPPTHDDSVE